MRLREEYFDGYLEGYEEDLTVTPWTPTKDPSIAEATATITNYHGERFDGVTIKATARYDLECGGITVLLHAGEGNDNGVQFCAPAAEPMMNMLEVLGTGHLPGGTSWEWSAVAWLAHQLVKSVYDDRDRWYDDQLLHTATLEYLVSMSPEQRTEWAQKEVSA